MNWREQLSFESLKPLKKWWKERQPREQALLAICALLLVGYGCYSLYLMLQSHVEQLEDQLKQGQLDLIWLEEKRIDMLRLKQQGGIELNTEQIRQVIETALTNSNLGNQSKVSPLEQGWKVDWQGKTPSQFMKAVSNMTLAGAIVKNFDLSRVGSDAKISVTLANR